MSTSSTIPASMSLRSIFSGDRIRTCNPQIQSLMLYQLSYSRLVVNTLHTIFILRGMELNHLSSGYEPDEIPFLYSALFWGTRIRTWTNGVKVRCPTIRRFPNVSKLTNNYIIFCPAFSSEILEKIHHTHSRLLLKTKKAPIL